MKRWIIPVLFSILLGYLAPSTAADDSPAAGGGGPGSLPMLNFPFDPGGPDAGLVKAQKGKTDITIEERKKKEQEAEDKKIDDAIKKAWEEN
jgi:hypothetical protein